MTGTTICQLIMLAARRYGDGGDGNCRLYEVMRWLIKRYPMESDAAFSVLTQVYKNKQTKQTDYENRTNKKPTGNGAHRR